MLYYYSIRLQQSLSKKVHGLELIQEHTSLQDQVQAKDSDILICRLAWNTTLGDG